MAMTQDSKYSHWRPEEVKLIDGLPVRFSDVCVHEFTVGDSEDPDLYAGEPIWNWQQSDSGKWVMEHAVEKPYWLRQHDYATYGYRYKIMARLTDKDQTFWRLKWGGTSK